MCTYIFEKKKSLQQKNEKKMHKKISSNRFFDILGIKTHKKIFK